MLNTYSTSQIASMIGVHPNTIRFYEELNLLPPIPRAKNGYRVFDDGHLLQLRLLRAAFRAEIISDRLRQEAVEIVKTAAAGRVDEAYLGAGRYAEHLREERSRAEEAIQITLDSISQSKEPEETVLARTRMQAAVSLEITKDVLRDWERNGLIAVPRDSSGYRVYGAREMDRLKIIRTLRSAHYSMMSILRMLRRMDQGEMNLRQAINTPDEEEDIVNAADRYCTALQQAEQDAMEMLEKLSSMQHYYSFQNE